MIFASPPLPPGMRVHANLWGFWCGWRGIIVPFRVGTPRRPILCCWGWTWWNWRTCSRGLHCSMSWIWACRVRPGLFRCAATARQRFSACFRMIFSTRLGCNVPCRWITWLSCSICPTHWGLGCQSLRFWVCWERGTAISVVFWVLSMWRCTLRVSRGPDTRSNVISWACSPWTCPAVLLLAIIPPISSCRNPKNFGCRSE